MKKMINTFRSVTHVFPALVPVTALAPAVDAGCGCQHAPGADRLPSDRSERAGCSSARTKGGRCCAPSWHRRCFRWPGVQHRDYRRHVDFQFISQGNMTHYPTIPDGALLDFGYTQLHSDGTELMNSAGHAANTANFCMGTWVRSGYFTYVLKSLCAQLRRHNRQPDGKDPRAGAGDSGSQQKPVHRHG